MTNKKLKLAAMSVALTACVAAQPMAAHQQALGVFVDGVYRISAFFHGDLLGCSFQIHPFIIP